MVDPVQHISVVLSPLGLSAMSFAGCSNNACPSFMPIDCVYVIDGVGVAAGERDRSGEIPAASTGAAVPYVKY